MQRALRSVRVDRSDISTFHGPYTRYLRAEGKAQGTIDKYLLALRQLEAFLADAGYPTTVAEIQRPHIEEFIASVLADSKSSTANTKFYSLKEFFNYLVADEEIRWHPMDGLKPPPAPPPPVPVLEGGHLAALLKECKGSSFEDRRDTAMILLLLDTGCRASEMANITLDRIEDGSIQVLGKGSKWRTVHFGATAGRALDKYLRARDRHKDADLPQLWLGKRGPMTRWGVAQTLEKRCAQAGVDKINPHQFRHTFAHEWLADGGQEGDLMRLTGWSSRSMVSRYAASAADARAAESYRKRQSPADKLRGK